MKKTSVITIGMLLLAAGIPADAHGPKATPRPEPRSAAYVLGELPGDKDDPAYKVYKAGYDLILEEKWEDGRKKLAELIAKYPKSDYVDDAKYWSAYALKHIDRKKAITDYKKFIDDYPESKYYDDAVADLNDLQSNWILVTSGDSARAVTRSSGHIYSYSVAPFVARSAREQVRAAEQVRREMRHMTLMSVPRPMAMPRLAYTDDEKLDPETRLKMDALYAIGETKEDSTSFKALRDVALDRSQPRQLRTAAMDALSDFRKFDVLPVFVEIAKEDTSEEMQNSAIEFVGQHSKDKNRSVETLIELFSTVPKYREEQLSTVLYSIADIGNDRAIDFLATVASSNDNYTLRSDAVYYLGNIGGDKARAALYRILRSK